MAMTKPLNLVITCDDGGLSEGIDSAVIDLFQQGFVSCVSVMPNMTQSKIALTRYQQIPSLEVGAHLVLTEGRPLTSTAQKSSLAKDGIFKNLNWLFMRGLFLSHDMQAVIYDELDAQMQFFIDNGSQPVHITTHHHFHLLPKLRSIIYDLAKKYQVKWVRNSRLRGAVIPNNPLIRKVKNKSQQHNFIEPDYIVLVMEWLKKSPQALLTQLEQLDGLIEVVIHPSTPADTTFPEHIIYQPEERYQEVKFMQAFFDSTPSKINIIQAS